MNKIVLDYDFQGLIYHGSVNQKTGKVCYLENEPHCIPKSWRKVETLPILDIETLYLNAKALPGTKEGYVGTFKDGTMVKLKGEE